MPDSSDVDAALVSKLGSDTALLGLMPNGVYFEDQAPPDMTQFVVVSLVLAQDTGIFGGRGYEDILYLVKAVERSTVDAHNIRAAAARIDALLERGTLTIPGYGLMVMRRSERVRYVETDPRDAKLRWSHRGGRYQVMVAPANGT
jgi:hypothetical protein